MLEFTEQVHSYPFLEAKGFLFFNFELPSTFVACLEVVEGEEQEERCLKNDEDVTVPFRVFHGAFSGVQD